MGSSSPTEIRPVRRLVTLRALRLMMSDGVLLYVLPKPQKVVSLDWRRDGVSPLEAMQ